MKLPRAILFDLDDTILIAFGPAQSQWQRTISAFADRLGPIEATVIATAIQAASTELWADPARHKYWRHRIGGARRRIVATAFAALGAAGHAVPPEAVGDALADAYNALHDEELSMFPDAHETLDRLKDLDVKLALITNGAAETQRAKVVRFALEHRFDHIQIEGEHGFGKPEERAYNHAMEVLGVGHTRPGWSATTSNGKSSRRNASASTRSGTTATASACPPTPRSAPTASSAAYRNCWSSRADWCASNGTRQSSN
jgi:putative hydrolase of the HAD superfamily